MLDARTDGRTDGHKGDFILYPMLCIALHSTDKKASVFVKQLPGNIFLNNPSTYRSGECRGNFKFDDYMKAV